jgi:hypothetical protein
MGTVVIHLNDGLLGSAKGAELQAIMESWARMLEEHVTSYLGNVKITPQVQGNTITIETSDKNLSPEEVIACLSQPLFGFGMRLEVFDDGRAGIVPCGT